MTHHIDRPAYTTVRTYDGRCCPPGAPATGMPRQRTATGGGVFSAIAANDFRSPHLTDVNQNR
ncbi:hypothetical protein F6V30_00925 [Oryzomonas sagensis]|uniref:Uncharacterized protein n=1 Tax=Oryzomonas sagensis TaxID=2603857 RepID=A0ABQ6TQ64_9BACT|nr:hypothetical protein [Oryzomonas sagensis]KAB0671186.1 hypothetical protein F6V30_00925 [Oryzomonas sagensis]